jgi:hypothetical protein
VATPAKEKERSQNQSGERREAHAGR